MMEDAHVHAYRCRTRRRVRPKALPHPRMPRSRGIPPPRDRGAYRNEGRSHRERPSSSPWGRVPRPGYFGVLSESSHSSTNAVMSFPAYLLTHAVNDVRSWCVSFCCAQSRIMSSNLSSPISWRIS